jgi:hypothetical protein
MQKKLLLLLLSLFIACDMNKTQPFVPDNTHDGEDVGVASQLFTAEAEPGTTRFKTNDPAYYTNHGATFWCLIKDQPEAEFTNREAALTKFTGNAGAGFGLVCGYRIDPVYGATMLVILINTEREYYIAEITANVIESIIPWKESLLLKQGYNQHNVVRLEYKAGQFNLYINGQLETAFRDDAEPLHTSGRNGYMAVISPLDDFPAIPVEVQFKE